MKPANIMITNIHEQICLHMSPKNEHWTGLHITYMHAWNVAFMMFIPFVKLHTYKNTAIIGIVYCSLLVFTILQKCMHASFLLSYSAGRFCMKYWLTCNHYFLVWRLHEHYISVCSCSAHNKKVVIAMYQRNYCKRQVTYVALSL